MKFISYEIRQLAQLMGHPCITDQEVFQKAMQEVGEPT